jgi:NitT/TauT family transport system substrate-binding protein
LATLTLLGFLVPAVAQQPVRIGVGYGLAFLPFYICEDLKLIEKHARDAQLDVKADFQRFPGAAPLQDAVASGALDMGVFGTAPLLAAWQKGKDTPRQVLAVSGVTTLPLVLLSSRPDVQVLTDLAPGDRIAVPTSSSPQMYLLRMQAEKAFGAFDHLDGQAVALAPGDAIADLIEGRDGVTAYFSSPPFTQLALRDARIHAVLKSSEVMDGKFSFLMVGATQAYIDAHPQIPQVIDQAMDEAARLIHDDPHRAAQIYLTHEPSKSVDGATMEAVIRDARDEFGSAVYGVQAMADFMGRHGQLKTPPQSWKDVVAPALRNSPSS